MAHILVQNQDPCEYFGFVREKTPDGAGIPARHVIRESPQLTKIDEDVFDALLRVNGGANIIATKLAEGRIIATGRNANQSDEVKEKIASVQAEFAHFLNIYKEARRMGGASNSALSAHLDSNGIPSLEMCRGNIGPQLMGEQYDQMKNRLARELANGLHSRELVIPGQAIKKTVAPDNKIDEKAMAGELDEQRFEKMLTKLEEAMPEMVRDDSNFDNKRRPLVAALKAFGISISKAERDHLWSMYLERYPEDESPEVE